MQKQYRIFHLIKSLGRGGAEVLLQEGLKHSDRERFTYSYGYFLPWKDALVKGLRDAGGDVVCFPSRNFFQMLYSTPKVISHIRSWKADLIHCHLPLAGVIGRLAAKRTGIPLIYTEHNVMERYHPWTRRLNLWTWKWQQAVVAVSGEVSSSIHHHTNSGTPVRVVQNGISVEHFVASAADRATIRKEYGIPPNALVIGTIAVFRPQKDLRNWLKAAQIVKHQFPTAHFLIVGDGILKEEIHQAAAEFGLKDVCHFPGLQEVVSPFYSAMDIYFNSSTFEGLPLTILEAMAMELPVVATSVGGVAEVVEEGQTGYLVRPEDPQMASERIAILLSDALKRREFGTCARKRVVERFSIARMTHDLENLYTDLIEQRSLVS